MSKLPHLRVGADVDNLDNQLGLELGELGRPLQRDLSDHRLSGLIGVGQLLGRLQSLIGHTVELQAPVSTRSA